MVFKKKLFSLKNHVITLRDETEWVELVDNRFNVLTGANREMILEQYNYFNFSSDFSLDLYGDHKASEKVVQELLHYQNIGVF